MRKVSIFLLSMILLFSCKKESDLGGIKQDLTGEWELETFIGYPSTQTFPPGNGTILRFETNGAYERKQAGTIAFQGTYRLLQKEDCHPRNNTTILLINEADATDYRYIEMIEGMLALSTPNCYQDGGTAYYRKIE